MALTPKNWASFQHYKDRAPLWIKLHRGLLDNIDYYRLSPEAGKALPLVWLIASERDGMIPVAAELSFRLRLSEDMAAAILAELTERGFLVATDEAKTAEQDATLAQRIAKSNGFGSRHISDATKRVVWERDGGKCCACGSIENIEYDHKHPVSKGGNSEEGNIQLLCRPCNRSKRVSLAAPVEQVATNGLRSRSLEKRREEIENIEEIEENGAIAPADPAIPEREYFIRGREVLGSKSGALIAKLLKAKGMNVALARAAIEQASQKQNPTEYVAAICHGGNNGKSISGNRTDSTAGRATAREAQHVASVGDAALQYLRQSKSGGSDGEASRDFGVARIAYANN